MRFVALALLLAACQTGQRTAYKDDHFDSVSLDGWTSSHEQDSLVFSSTRHPHNTILVRAVPISSTGEEIIDATTTVLNGLPAAHVAGPNKWDGGQLDGVVFNLSYEPSSRMGQRYERQHVVLVGKHFAFHVVNTAPAGQLAASQKDFETLIANLHEEG